MTTVKKIMRWLMYASVVLLGLIVLSAALIRFVVFPNIHSYKDTIADYATKQAGQKITIGDITTSWNGVSPHITLASIDVFDTENRPALHLNNVAASISWLSVPLMQPRLSHLVIQKPALTIRRQQDGSIFLAGISLAGQSKPALPNWLLSQSEISIINAQLLWLDDLRQAPPLALNNLNLNLRNPAWRSLFGQHQFTFSAKPSIGTTQAITADGYFVGKDVSKINSWHGSLNADLKQADLSVWRPWLDYPVNLESGTGDAQLSLDFADSKFEKVAVRTNLSNVSLLLNSQTTPLIAKQLSGDIGWRDFNNTQTISAKNLKLNTNTGLNINNGNAYLTNSQKNGQPWHKADVKLDNFDLAALKQLAPYFKLPENLVNQLNNFAPSGQLQALSLGFEGDVTHPKNYQISANFKGLGLKSRNKIPGFSNLTGQINATEDGGKMSLQSQQASPEGIDVYFDNVGGDHLEAAISALRQNGRAAICGMISVYNATEPTPGPRNMPMIIGKRLTLRGFLVFDHADLRPQFEAEVGQWLADGKIVWRETVVEGIDNAVNGFRDLMAGSNKGKMLIRL